MPKGLKVSCPLIGSFILTINISNVFEWKYICIMTFRVAHQDDSFVFWYGTRGRCYWAYLWQVSCVYILVCKRKIFLSILRYIYPKPPPNKKSPLCTTCMHLLLPNVCMCYIVVVNVTYVLWCRLSFVYTLVSL